MADTSPNSYTTAQLKTMIDCPLDRRTEHNIHAYSMQTREAIDEHLRELDREWSTERTNATIGNVIALLGLVLGAFISSWFLLIPLTTCLFSLAHNVFNFTPLLTLWRHSNMRANCQINTEKFAMKAMRGNGRQLNDDDKVVLAERTIVATKEYASSI
ncbi:MAG: hypothetical protein K2X81_23770 [Candidatus Obscuribacterales bacterium]|nr:hypothetical protein [Candidatus Obscuribacterales bacterium]